MRTPSALTLGLLAVLAVPTMAPSAAAADETQSLFAAKCLSCHTVGDGPRVGPDLAGVGERRDRAWLVDFVAEPSAMLDSDPDAKALLAEYNGIRMPDLGLTREQAEALVELLTGCQGDECKITVDFVPVTKATAEDIALGARLFSGAQPLYNGGPPCMSCHTVHNADVIVPGGTLGPDLTRTFSRLGDKGLDATLAEPQFDMMKTIFGYRPLSEEEVFALRAYLYDSNKRGVGSQAGYALFLAGLLGALIALIALNAAWSRRLSGGQERKLAVAAGQERTS